MAKIKQLKDKSGTEQIFPKTKTQAIYNTDGTLLSETLDDLYGSLATIESSPTTTSHSVGEYILYEGQVYKVTSVIASGDSLVVGTNISAVNLGDQISTLNGQVSTLNSKITSLYEIKTVTCNGDGASGLHAFSTPAISGYTAVAIAGYGAIGGYEGARGIYQLNINPNNKNIAIGWESAVPSNRGLSVYVLYLRD